MSRTTATEKKWMAHRSRIFARVLLTILLFSFLFLVAILRAVPRADVVAVFSALCGIPLGFVLVNLTHSLPDHWLGNWATKRGWQLVSWRRVSRFEAPEHVRSQAVVSLYHISIVDEAGQLRTGWLGLSQHPVFFWDKHEETLEWDKAA